MPGRTLSFSQSSSKNKSLHSKSMPPSAEPQIQEKQGFLSNIVQGFALGTGQAIAHNMFRSNPTINQIHTSSPTTSLESTSTKEYEKCMKDTQDDKEACKHFF